LHIYNSYSIYGETSEDTIYLNTIDIASNSNTYKIWTVASSNGHNNLVNYSYIKFSKNLNKAICFIAGVDYYGVRNSLNIYDLNSSTIQYINLDDSVFSIDSDGTANTCSCILSATDENAYALLYYNGDYMPNASGSYGKYYYAAVYSTDGSVSELYNLDLRDGSGGPAYSINSATPIAVDEYGSGMLVHYGYGEMDHNGRAYLYYDNENNELSRISIFNNYYENAADAPDWDYHNKTAYVLESKYTKAYVCKMTGSTTGYFIKDITNLKSSEIIDLLKFDYSPDDSWAASSDKFAVNKDFGDASILIHNGKIYGPSYPNLNDENAYVKVK